MGTQFNDVYRRFDRQEILRTDELSEQIDDPLFPLPNDTGVFPPDNLAFPLKRGDLRNLSNSQLVALLRFYRLSTTGNRKSRKQRLRQFIGVRLTSIG